MCVLDRLSPVRVHPINFILFIYLKKYSTAYPYTHATYYFAYIVTFEL